MRQILNYKQLAVMWIVGIVVCSHLIINYGIRYSQPRGGYWISPFGEIEQRLTTEEKFKQWVSGFRVYDWNYTLIYPLLIIGGLLVVTFGKRELLEEIAQRLRSRKAAQELDKTRRKRDASFVKCWKKGMSDEELAKKFNLKIQGVKALKERLKGG